jgi:hypothetical protein
MRPWLKTEPAIEQVSRASNRVHLSQRARLTGAANPTPDQSPCSTPERRERSRSLGSSVVCSRRSSGSRGLHERDRLRRSADHVWPCSAPTLTILPSRSIVFLAGSGSSMPAASFSTQRISCRFSHARLRDALDASSSSSSFWSSSGVIDMAYSVRVNTAAVKPENPMNIQELIALPGHCRRLQPFLEGEDCDICVLSTGTATPAFPRSSRTQLRYSVKYVF